MYGKCTIRLVTPFLTNNVVCNKHIINIFFRSSINFFNTHRLRFASTETKKKDEDVCNRVQVYHGVLTPKIRAIKLFSLLTSTVGIICQPFIYEQVAVTESLPLVVAVCSFVGFFTFITPFLLHYITKKYVTHVDYIPKTGHYVASTVNFFCMTKETKFSPDEVKIPDIPGMFTTFEVGGKGMFLDANQFQDPTHYGKIMGYDKPIDFKLYESDNKKM